jgi:prephenate dehydratase
LVKGKSSAPAEPVSAAVEGLRKHCEQVKILGSYPAARPPD